MPEITTKLGSLHVTESGNGSPLLLLSANPGSHRDFDAVAPELSRRFRVISVDWPGFGGSPPPADPASASATYFARVAGALVEAMDLRGVSVIGNSVGGYSAVRLALTHPDRVASLVLVNSGGFTAPSAVARAFCWLKGREWITRHFEAAFARAYLRVRNDHVREAIARSEALRRNPASVAVIAGVWRSFSNPEHDLREVARGVRVPTLVAWGRRDPVLPLREGKTCHASIPGAELTVFDTGHMPFAEAPQAFLDAVVPFLDRVTHAADAA